MGAHLSSHRAPFLTKGAQFTLHTSHFSLVTSEHCQQLAPFPVTSYVLVRAVRMVAAQFASRAPFVE